MGKKRNYIDDMVDLFGYDYVIGFCLCSEYDLRNKAKTEEDEDKAKRYIITANKYKAKGEQLTKERIENGL